MTPKLPPPKYLRRQQRRDGGYDMVPAYTAEEMQAYGLACLKQGLGRAAEICAQEAPKWKHPKYRYATAAATHCEVRIRKEITP